MVIPMITKGCEITDNCNSGLLFTKDARSAWGHIVKSINRQSVNILLPSYIGRNEKEGSGVFDPVLKYNTNFQFYDVNENLSVNLESMSEILDKDSIDVVLVIHYFGFCRSDMEKIKEICCQRNVVLVEDCAHYFQLGAAKPLIGNYGDFSFYSIHKYLPTRGGGFLKINNKDIVLDELSLTDKIDLESLEIFSTMDFKKISNRRIENFKQYERFSFLDRYVEVLYGLQSEDMPHTFPIRVKDGYREKLYFHLLKNDIPTVALYYRMIDEIEIENFPLSHLISSEILNLPVHQDITTTDISRVCSSINDFFRNLDNG